MRWGFHTHRLSHQVSSKGSRGTLMTEKGQWDSPALTPAPHPRAPTLTSLSLWAPGGPTTACGNAWVSHLSFLPPPLPLPRRPDGRGRLGLGLGRGADVEAGGQEQRSPVQGSPRSRLSLGPDRARQTW